MTIIDLSEAELNELIDLEAARIKSAVKDLHSTDIMFSASALLYFVGETDIPEEIGISPLYLFKEAILSNG